MYDFTCIDGYLSWALHAVVVFLIIAVSLYAVFQIFTPGMRAFTQRMKGVIFKLKPSIPLEVSKKKHFFAKNNRRYVQIFRINKRKTW